MENFDEIVKLLQTSGPAVVAVLLLYVWWDSRKENKVLQQEIIKIANEQIRATTKVESALISLKEVIDRFLNQRHDHFDHFDH